MEREIKTTDKINSRARSMGITILKSIRVSNTTKRLIRCDSCSSEYYLQDQTLNRWNKAGKKFCGYCNGSQKALPPTLKCRQLNDKLTGTVYEKYITVSKYLGYDSSRGQAYCVVKFLECGREKVYSTTVFGGLIRDGKAFKYTDRECITQTASEMERVVGRELPAHYISQVPYSSIAECSRKWSADFFSILDKTVIEVSSGSTKDREDYISNLKEKKDWCEDNGFTFILIDSLTKLYDIVQSLGKPKGVNT